MEGLLCSLPCSPYSKFWSPYHLPRPPDKALQPSVHQALTSSSSPPGWRLAVIQADFLVENTKRMASSLTLKVVLKQGSDYDAHPSNGSVHDKGVGWDTLNFKDALSLLEQASKLQPSVEDYIHILVKCTKEKNIAYALHMHDCICMAGMEANGLLGDYLVSMWVEAGSMNNAQKLFDKLVFKTAYSWSTLIKGYIKSGNLRHALTLYHSMREYALHPDEGTWVSLLNACAALQDVDTGSEIHDEILMNGSSQTLRFVGSSLVDMYAKCGSLAKAQEVFDMLPARDVVAWTALMTGYAKHERGAEALDCFQKMQWEGVPPNAFTFACSLKACGSTGFIDMGKEIHAHIMKSGLLGSNVFVSNSLIDMYARCGLLAKAQNVFDELPIRDVVSWTALISGYTKHDNGTEALSCFNQMQSEGIRADVVTYSCVLKSCGSIRALEKGREIHAKIASEGFLKGKGNLSIANSLIDMYAKCNMLEEAQKVFNSLAVHDVITWNSLIGGYVLHDNCEQALSYFAQMHISPDEITYASILKACGRIGAIEKATEIHSEIARNGLLQKDRTVGNALIDMYGKCGMLGKAQEVFDKLVACDVVSWNTLISAYAQHECGEEAVHYLQRMQFEGVPANAFSFASSLKACGSIKSIVKGREIHSDIVKKGLLEDSLVVGNALVDLYAKCGLLVEAHEVFDKLSVHDVVSWTALILGYVDQERNEEALSIFTHMQSTGTSPNSVTLACCLKACGGIEATDVGREMHVEIARRKLLEEDPILVSVLIDMYAVNGLLAEAQEVFDTIPVHDVGSWTSLIAGYVENDHSEEALSLYNQMQLEGVSPSISTFSCVLKACGNAGALTTGKEVHAAIERASLLQDNLVLGTALVDMYAKCGLIVEALNVFKKLQAEDIVLWNTLITGYTQLGETESVLDIFEILRRGYHRPNMVTFLNVLNACSHAGLVDEAHSYFETMSKDYGITLALEHHTCIIDLLGRAGQVDQAVAILMVTPFDLNVPMWLAVLGACRKWANVDLGRLVFDQAVNLGGFDAAVYVCMHNIYADVDIEDDALGNHV